MCLSAASLSVRAKVFNQLCRVILSRDKVRSNCGAAFCATANKQIIEHAWMCQTPLLQGPDQNADILQREVGSVGRSFLCVTQPPVEEWDIGAAHDDDQ